MADGVGGDGEEAAIERQLESQLEEQKESLAAVDEALASDPNHPELISVHEELLLAIKDAEEGLLHLKRSRLLMETETILLRQEPEIFEDDKVEHLDPRQNESEPLEAEIFSVGSKCRFRHTDGRWYNGYVISLGSASSARISFLTPTSESMLMCKFFLQQRCRFGSNCRLLHGFDVPISSLKQYIHTRWQQSLVGSRIWAVSGAHSGIWRKAELKSWDDELGMGQVAFQDDRSSAKLGTDSLSISQYALISEDEEDSNSSSEGSDFTEEEDPKNASNHQGLGFLETTKLQRGVQTETVIFAKWEHHTRGIASKMMASMGYRKGMGLGISSQGIVDPIPVKVLPPRQSLDHALASNEIRHNSKGRGKKRSRGGKRMREKKYAALARAAKTEAVPTSDVFSFINNQLASQDVVDGLGSTLKRVSDEVLVNTKGEDRRSLVAFNDEVKELRNRVEKLEEMVSRNRKEKVVYEAALRKLNETRKTLADVEAAHASASTAVITKEKEKKWLKF